MSDVEFLTVAQAADKLDLHVNTIYKMTRDGRLKFLAAGPRRILIYANDLENIEVIRGPYNEVLAIARIGKGEKANVG